MDLKVHHIGYAVSDIDAAIKAKELIGFDVCSPITEDSLRNVKIVFMKNGETVIELVASNGEPNPVEGIIKKNGSGPYHICYEVDDISEAKKELKAGGWMLIKRSEPAPAIDNRNVAFFYHKDAGMIELVEK